MSKNPFDIKTDFLAVVLWIVIVAGVCYAVL
jgi:hypothetical protein